MKAETKEGLKRLKRRADYAVLWVGLVVAFGVGIYWAINDIPDPSPFHAETENWALVVYPSICIVVFAYLIYRRSKSHRKQ